MPTCPLPKWLRPPKVGPGQSQDQDFHQVSHVGSRGPLPLPSQAYLKEAVLEAKQQGTEQVLYGMLKSHAAASPTVPQHEPLIQKKKKLRVHIQLNLVFLCPMLAACS